MRRCQICNAPIIQSEFPGTVSAAFMKTCASHFRTISRKQPGYIKNSIPNNIDLALDKRYPDKLWRPTLRDRALEEPEDSQLVYTQARRLQLDN
jgi:hypothetical protein